jgi:putative GTP pyrophosphokinase
VQAGVVEQLSAAFERRLPLLAEASIAIEQLARVALDGYEHEHIDRIYFRVKSPASFATKVHARKAQPPYTNPLAQVEDQIGGRVIVFFTHDIDPIIDLLAQAFNRVELIYKTPEKDAEFGYESSHVVCHIPPQARPAGWTEESSMPETFELQVRTLFMHAWAEPQHNLQYKAPSELTRNQHRLLGWVAASAWGADHGLEEAWKEIGLPIASSSGAAGGPLRTSPEEERQRE